MTERQPGVEGRPPRHARHLCCPRAAPHDRPGRPWRPTLAHLIEECEAVRVNAELPRLFKAMADRSIAAGHGGEQYPVLIEEFGRPGTD
ncbi:hypothetical protein ACF1G5_05590 [Streptomyces coeruleorubidus]|uniref:imine reductase family protein n=1 Tax=Streptomyces coeruleorubidus TaxID=116188 RepID=UPI0036F89DDD